MGGNYVVEEAIEKIIFKVKELGLDFYDMYFEICPADIIYTLNPYYLGLKIFEDIEKRWNQPIAEEKKKYKRSTNP